MPYVEVKESDLRRLRELAGIFEIKDVITKLIDDFLEDYTKPQVGKPSTTATEYSFDDLPSLVHAKFISGKIGDIASNSTTWNGFLEQCLEIAHGRLGGFGAVARVVPLNIVAGERAEEGYRYVPSIDLSFQGVSASYAARYIGQIGKALNSSVEIDFLWRTKEEALKPGESGRLIYRAR
ncbi:T4SS efffector SepA family protein [Neotabrizicola shimadae]|uniref:Uncharacterized protein n=1 Tax=Neotabrizicola shimadae TaxID=2807096 RepID=A0A8G0ZUI3_9RHOB|nr:hypothetical protein [Neotabrizicola shimadae]QYZ68880.1 hypothetical protein JO391_14085 [Neotabrizicola shimadae]